MAFASNPDDPLDRYSRQVRFHAMGEEGQKRLMPRA
jgi:molybdopterin/thiamine biosynthesis adenylyltransferase